MRFQRRAKVGRQPARFMRLARTAALLAGCLWAAGCATWSTSFDEIERRLVQEQYTEALAALERQGDGRREPLLYQLNKAMTLRMAGDYQASNAAFEAAKVLMDKYSAVSLREKTATFIINDAAEAYAGEEHEQVLLHLYEALNYIALGNLDDARVEALQVDLKLREQAERAGTSYVEDPFARYLTGMIYEDRGEWSDALIAYRKSYEAYSKRREKYGVAVPQALKNDLLRLTQHLGLADEMRRYQKEFGIARFTDQATWRTQGELVFLLHNGLAPIKREHATTVLDPASGHWIRIAVPYYEQRFPVVRAARVVAGPAVADTEVVADIQAQALNTLEAKMPAITARALARAVVKAELARAARAKGRGNRDDAMAAAIIGFGMEVASVLTERADTRSWATLPHDIQIARLALPPGSYKIRIELLGADSASVGAIELPDVVIRPGRKTYLSRYSIASQVVTSRRMP
ncbi:MAG: COG3014 family protein [Sulfurifustaceae bacterium]